MTSSQAHRGPSSLLRTTSSTRLISQMIACLKGVRYHLETAFLFTKTDIITTLIPIVGVYDS